MTDEELDALVFALDHDHPDDIDYRACSTAITTLRAQLAEAREWKRYWSGEMDVVLAGRADETARADRAEAEISRLTDLNSTAYIDGHDAAKNEYRAEIQRLETLNSQLMVMVGEDAVGQIEAAVAAQIEEAATEIGKLGDDLAYFPALREHGLPKRAYDLSAAIRNQPHDRTALDNYREKVLREAYDSLFKHPGFIHAISGQKFKAVKLEDAAEGILALGLNKLREG